MNTGNQAQKDTYASQCAKNKPSFLILLVLNQADAMEIEMRVVTI